MTLTRFYFSAIEVITSGKRIILKQDPYTGEFIKTKVSVWNPTVANLTLMALGSSAPEILLSIIETVQTLGKKPGELGASCIVGSAAFNFLIISALSIWVVNEENDNRTQQERTALGTPKGVKKVQDTGVFAITTIWSIIAYIWLYIVLIDGIVEEWEAFVTLGMFFMLLIMAYVADCCRTRTIEQRENAKFGENEKVAEAAAHKGKIDLSGVRALSHVDFYNKLLPIEAGKPVEKQDEQLTTEMKEFLLQNFGTIKVSEVNRDALKAKLDGPALIERISHRKAVAVNYRKEAISKFQVIRRENKQASTLKDS